VQAALALRAFYAPELSFFTRFSLEFHSVVFAGALARAALGLLTTLAARVDNLVPTLVQVGAEGV
jgi:hypothetical protein